MDYEVRRLTADDAEAFRAIRLEGLQNHPEAFAASYEVEAQMALEDIARRLAKGTVFGGFEGSELMGVVGFSQLKSPKARHKGILWGMYVKPAARGGGLARTLVETVLEHASSGVELVHLTAVTSNQRALRFYKKMGFENFGVERHALKIGDQYYDEALLVRFLD